MPGASKGAATTIYFCMKDILYCEEPAPLEDAIEYVPPQDSNTFVSVIFTTFDKKLENAVEENQLRSNL